VDVRCAGEVFQPVPWSPDTRFGMPRSFEVYHNNPEYAICNVPPVTMFTAKCFKPSRLCAVYKVQGQSRAERKTCCPLRAVPAFELAISPAIFHSKDLSEKNLT
jgi:hypothetical protein